VGVVTNQPVVARGDVTISELDAIHGRLEALLAETQAFLDGIYVCPHHPESGFPGEVASLKGPCACRKPATGLINQAVADLGLDTSFTWLIGDTTADVQCAVRAGLFPVLVGTGHAGGDGQFPTDAALRFEDAPTAIDFIVTRFGKIWRRAVAAASTATPGTQIVVIAKDAQLAANAVRLVAMAVRRRRILPRPNRDAAGADSASVQIVADVVETGDPDDIQITSISPQPT
jgi:histidinol-phosphate phosphatase family protein